jgi:hypothetical protein
VIKLKFEWMWNDSNDSDVIEVYDGERKNERMME